MGVWTITYLGNEQSAAAWGLNAEPVLRLRQAAAAQFGFTLLGADPAGAGPFPFEGKVTIRQNRLLAGGAFINDSSAWHFVFQGRLVNVKGWVSGAGQELKVVFHDSWYDLETIPFQQLWTIPGGTAYFSRCYLFYNGSTPPGYLTVAQQVTAIVDYAASCGANIQPGTIQGSSQMLWWPVRGMKCDAAIKKCLEFFPDLIAWVDGSTNPPSFNLVYRANLTPVAMPWKGIEASGRQHDSGEITALTEEVPSQVVLQYQTTISSGGTSAVQLTTDAWPPGSTGRALRALVAPIDLRGSTASFSESTIVTQLFDPTDVVNFWQKHVRSLADADIVGTPTIVDTSINTGSTYGISVKDSSGNPINYAALYPVEMIEPSKWASWTGVNVIEATVGAYLSYTKAAKVGTAATARNTDVVTGHLHTTKINLCNAPLGTKTYQTETAYNSGETQVTGLAQAIYNSLTQLQYDGNHTIIEPVVSQIIGPWNTLNLTGGNAAWATMNAQISEVEIDFFHNTTRIGIGPAKHLSPQDLNNYLQMFRQRIMFDNAQISGGNAVGAAIDLSGKAQKEDSVTAQPQQGLKEFRAPDATTSANTNIFTHDLANGQFVMQQFDPTGAVNTGAPSIKLASADITTAGTTNKAAKFQVVSCCQNDGTIKKFAILATNPE